MTLDWQVLQFPFAAGVDTKRHAYAVEPPGLASASNVEFDEVGGLRLRKPYASIGSNIYGGGTLSNVRKIEAVGDELLCFTDTSLYSWSETLTAWILKGTHLAVAVTETPRFGNPNDQVFVDRAQLGGVIVYAWTEVQGSGGASRSYLAAVDATTGVALIAPTAFGSTATHPRVVATDTKIMVFWRITGTGLVVGSIDPAAPTFAAGILAIVSANEHEYDVIRGPSGGTYSDFTFAITRDTATTHYTVSRITTAGVVTSSTKTRAATGIVTLAVPVSGDVLQVIRQDGTNVMGDRLKQSDLSDVATGLTIGSSPAATISQITGAFRSVTDGGYYRCYVFWAVEEGDAVNDNASSGVQVNWIDANSSIGTQTFLVYRQSIVSHAFDYGGRVFLWTGFSVPNNAGTTVVGFEVAVQNSNFLHRDDGEYFAKATWGRAGGPWWVWNGISAYTVSYSGHLPGVALVSGTTGYAWTTTERNFTDLGGRFATKGYAARSPRDVTFTFDSDDARRVVQFGRTAYVSGGLLLQYDGEGLAEVGFEQFPWYIDCVDDGTAGALAVGSYTYKTTFRWDNARGETERSTTAIGQALVVAASKKPKWWSSRLRVTRKTDSRRPPAIECWRTQVNPSVDSAFYLITSRDPAATGDNGYVANAVSSAGASYERDNLTDAELATREQNPETGIALPRLAPPAATIVVASESRLFLAGVPAEPCRIWYSLQRNDGEIAAFNPALVIELPAVTGAITALAVMDGTLVAWTATACYAIPGDGYDNTGGGSNYGPPRLISTDIGASSHDAVALTPGGLAFFSRKGWYRLGRGWDLEYIGAPVEDFNSRTWIAAQVVESQHQMRVLASSSWLVWDYLLNQWASWAPGSGVVTQNRDLAIWRGYPMFLSSAVQKQATSYTGNDYDLDIETGWIKVNGLQGFGRVRRFMILALAPAAFTMRVQVGYDYAASYTDDRTITVTPSTASDGVQVRQGLSRQRVEAIRVRITIDGDTLAGDPPVLTGLALEVGLRSGIYPRLPAARKQ